MLDNDDVIKLLLKDKKFEHDVIWLSIHNKYPSVKIRDYLTHHFALIEIDIDMDDVRHIADELANTVLVVSYGQ